MDEISKVATSPGGLVGIIGGAIISAALFLRKYWLGDRVNAANSEAHVDIIERLNQLVDKANARADAAEAKADVATKALHEAVHQMADLKAEVHNLNNQVQQLRNQLHVQSIKPL